MPVDIRRVEQLMRRSDARPYKHPSRWGSAWYKGPALDTGHRMHGDALPSWYAPEPYSRADWWRALTPWMWIAGEEDPNNPNATLYTATNTRVQVRNLRLHVRRSSWTLENTLVAPTSRNYSYTVTGGDLGVTDRSEASNGGGMSYKLLDSARSCPHPFGNSVGISDPWNVTGIAVDVECRLIMDNAGGSDDRANAKAVVGIAVDLYPFANSPPPTSGYWVFAVAAGFARVTNDWQFIGANTYFSGSGPALDVSTLPALYTSSLILADSPNGWTDGGGGTVNPPAPPVPSNPRRIMFLGDSLTLGDDHIAGRFRTYRGRTLADLAAAGLSIDAIGMQYRPPAIGGDPDCEGYGGAFISHPSDSNNIQSRLPNIMAAAGTLDIVVLMAGWNDCYNYTTNIADRYTTLVNAVRAAQPSATIIVCTITPQQGETEAQTAAGIPAYGALNTRVRQIAQQAGFKLADCASAPLVSSDYWDVIHYLQPGADKVGTIIANAIKDVTATIPNPAPDGNYVVPNAPKLLTVFPDIQSGKLVVAAGGPRLIAPVINTQSVTNAQIGVPWSVTLDVTGDPVPTLSVTAGTLPSWMTISGLKISGTPPGNAAATFDFTLTATNSAGTSAPQQFTGSVQSLPVVNVATPARMTVGTAAYIALTATGTGPFTWFLDSTSPALPTGLEISGSAIVGIPSAQYSNSIVVRVQGAGGLSEPASITLAVDSPYVPPTPQAGQWERIERDVQVWVRVPRDT